MSGGNAESPDASSTRQLMQSTPAQGNIVEPHGSEGKFRSYGLEVMSLEEKRQMESCIRISLSEYIDPDQSQQFDHSGRNEIWREPFPPARTCDTHMIWAADESALKSRHRARQ